MLPTINHNTIVLAETISARLGKVGSGDVVLIRSPEDPTKIVTKRIKAVEGDVVSYVLDPNSTDEKKTAVVIYPNSLPLLTRKNPLLILFFD